MQQLGAKIGEVQTQALIDHVLSQVCIPVETQVRWEVQSQIEDQVWDQVYWQIKEAVDERSK